MPELWLRKVFPGVLYVNSNTPEKRVRMMLSKKKIAELPKESTDIYKKDMINRYMIRPHDALFLNNFVIYYSLNDISCKQNHLKMSHNLRNW